MWAVTLVAARWAPNKAGNKVLKISVWERLTWLYNRVIRMQCWWPVFLWSKFSPPGHLLCPFAVQYSSARCSLLSCFFTHTWSCHAPCQSTARFLPALSAPNSSLESFYTPSRYRTGLLTITDKLKCRAPAEGAVWELREKKKKAWQEQKSLLQPRMKILCWKSHSFSIFQ